MNEFEMRVSELLGERNLREYPRYLNPAYIQYVLETRNRGVIKNFLLVGFYWAKTPQGRDFWADMHVSAKLGDFRLWEEKGRPLFAELFAAKQLLSVEEML